MVKWLVLMFLRMTRIGRAGFMDVWPVQSHGPCTPKGPTLILMLCCPDLELLSNFGAGEYWEPHARLRGCLLTLPAGRVLGETEMIWSQIKQHCLVSWGLWEVSWYSDLGEGLWVQQSWVTFLCHLLVMALWARYLHFLGISFLIYKMGMVVLLLRFLRGCVEILQVMVRNTICCTGSTPFTNRKEIIVIYWFGAWWIFWSLLAL